MKASESPVLNPFLRLGLEQRDGRTQLRVRALRRGIGWRDAVVAEHERPRLFALLQALRTAAGDVELDLDEEDAAALHEIGLLVPPDEVAQAVRFCAPLQTEATTVVAAPDPDECSEAEDALSVHPTLAREAPRGIDVPRVGMSAGPVIWLGDARSGLTAPYWTGALATAVDACVPGAPAPSLDGVARRQLRAAGVLVAPGEVERQKAARAAELATAASELERFGYAAVPALMPRAQLLALRRYYRELIAEGHVHFGDFQVERRYSRHNEPLARLFLTALTDVVCVVAGAPFKPAYVYLASYREGAVLERHRDRAQCELSISLLLDYEPSGDDDVAPWPLWVARGADDPGTALHQRPGDGIVYRGCEIDHWRTRLPDGHRSTHLFLHYVPRDFVGPLD